MYCKSHVVFHSQPQISAVNFHRRETPAFLFRKTQQEPWVPVLHGPRAVETSGATAGTAMFFQNIQKQLTEIVETLILYIMFKEAKILV